MRTKRCGRERPSAAQKKVDQTGNLHRFTPGNQISLLESGSAYFCAIEAEFIRAKHEIYLESYIFANDTTGRRIAHALSQAALRGVKVHLLIDGYGSKDLPPSMLDRLRTDGVKVSVYRPDISPWTFRRKRLRRMHRKIVVVDRKIAFVGGININDDREMMRTRLPRYDYAVRVEGPLVKVICHSVKHLWILVGWSSFRKGTLRNRKSFGTTFARGKMRAAFLVRDNFLHRRDIETAYLRAIDRAKPKYF